MNVVPNAYCYDGGSAFWVFKRYAWTSGCSLLMIQPPVLPANLRANWLRSAVGRRLDCRASHCWIVRSVLPARSANSVAFQMQFRSITHLPRPIYNTQGYSQLRIVYT